eukprot:1151796-Prymnesium_polylepis.1
MRGAWHRARRVAPCAARGTCRVKRRHGARHHRVRRSVRAQAASRGAGLGSCAGARGLGGSR